MKMLEILEQFEKIGKMMFVEKNYIEGDINKFITELRNSKIESYSEDIPTDYKKLIEGPLMKLNVITEVIYTKKIEKNKKDFTQLGEYLKEVADELIKIGESN